MPEPITIGASGQPLNPGGTVNIPGLSAEAPGIPAGLGGFDPKGTLIFPQGLPKNAMIGTFPWFAGAPPVTVTVGGESFPPPVGGQPGVFPIPRGGGPANILTPNSEPPLAGPLGPPPNVPTMPTATPPKSIWVGSMPGINPVTGKPLPRGSIPNIPVDVPYKGPLGQPPGWQPPPRTTPGTGPSPGGGVLLTNLPTLILTPMPGEPGYVEPGPPEKVTIVLPDGSVTQITPGRLMGSVSDIPSTTGFPVADIGMGCGKSDCMVACQNKDNTFTATNTFTKILYTTGIKDSSAIQTRGYLAAGAGLFVTAGGADITGAVVVNGAAAINGSLNVLTSLTVGGNATFQSAVAASDGVYVTGGPVICSAGVVQGKSLVSLSTLSVDSSATIGGFLLVSGNFSAAGLVTLSGAVTFGTPAGAAGAAAVDLASVIALANSLRSLLQACGLAS